MKRLKKISLLDLSIHDLRRTLRSPQLKLSAYDILKLLHEQKQKTQRIYAGGLGLSIVLLIWIYSTNADATSHLTLSAFGTSVDVRLTFILLGMAAGLYSAVDGMQNFAIIDQHIAEVSRMISRHGNPGILSVALDVSAANNALGQFRYSFWSFDRRFGILRSIQSAWLFLIIVLAAILVYTGFSIAMFKLFWRGDISFVEQFALVLGAMLTLYPIFGFFFLFVPSRFIPNQLYLRWSFLARIHRKSGLPHPSHWFAGPTT